MQTVSPGKYIFGASNENLKINYTYFDNFNSIVIDSTYDNSNIIGKSVEDISFISIPIDKIETDDEDEAFLYWEMKYKK